MKTLAPSQFVALRARALQFLEYMVGGATYFWSGYIIFAICYSGLHWNWLPAKLMADGVGWTFNYLIQRYWAFDNPRLQRREGATVGKYGLITAVNLALDYLIIWALKREGITPYIGFFVSSAFFTIWNYLWYRFWVFYVRRGGNAKEVA